MAHNLYVGGFPYQTTKEELSAFFSKVGVVKNAKVIMDRETGRPKGFGFVEMATDAQANDAIAKLNGAEIGGRKIFVVAGRIQNEKKSFTRPGAPAPAPAKYTGPERRSGKDRRQGADAGRRADSAAPAPAPGEKPRWEKKPFDPTKPRWEKKPYDPSKKWPKKSFGDKKPFGAKKWDKPKNPHAKPDVPFKKTVPPLRGKKWFPKDK